MTRTETTRRPVLLARARARTSEAVTRRIRGPARTRATVPSATLQRLLETHRERILLAAATCDARDLEGAIIQGVHGLMDAMSAQAKGSRRALDALCASAIERRMADYWATTTARRAA